MLSMRLEGRRAVMTSRCDRSYLVGVAIVMLLLVVGCGGADGAGGGAASAVVPGTTPTPTATGAERYVTVGFWADPTCSGPPTNTNRFPVHYGDTQCYSWPGRSGENSASRFACGDGTFSYMQWTTLTCSGGQNPTGTRKTTPLTGCTQDIPPTLYARVVDFSGCMTAVQ